MYRNWKKSKFLNYPRRMHVISGIGETTGAWGVRVLVATRGVRRPTRGRFVVR